MTDPNLAANTFSDDEFAQPKLPTMLNVLTILTFIGCGISFLFTIFSPKIWSFSKDMMAKAQSSGKEISAKEAADMQKSLAQIELAEANMIPLMVIGLACTTLCLVGAIMMRKLKKDGFWIYTAGELLPFVVTPIIMGMGQLKETGNIFFLVLAIAFVAMYATQRKFLVK
jgi:hypothetical protein